jgi:aromatic-L-amino-acid decarboxylase
VKFSGGKLEIEEFRKEAHRLVDWMADYLKDIRSYPVKSQVKPKETINRLPEQPPENGQPFNEIMADFDNTIMPGITHWQHPSFFAYFPANSSPPSVLAEMLTATIGAQCMIWQTSPAAAELEERMTEWLRQMLSLPAEFTGVIQDTASTATLCSILSARERHSNFKINNKGLFGSPPVAVYCSRETHSSIDKAVRIAGLGIQYLRKIDVDENLAMKPEALENRIQMDLINGIQPLCVIATMGTTGSTAIDPIESIGRICRDNRIWLHVDAAYAGTALLLPEMRWMSKGLEMADTFVFNPHKWMFTNFDCSAYFVKDPSLLIRTFEILPEYLKTGEASRVNNYRDWGIPLGRRFRALKLWFVIRMYGVSGLQKMIRDHLDWAKELTQKIDNHADFELLAPVPLNLICFRYHPTATDDPEELDKINSRLLEALNRTGKIYLTHTRLNGKYTLRFVASQTNVTKDDIMQAWDLIKLTAEKIE